MKNKLYFDNKKIDESGTKVASPWMLAVLGYLLLLGWLAALIDDALPAAMSAEQAGNTSFSEERAWVDLRTIVGAGERVAGTRYHLEQTETLYQHLQQVASEAVQPVRVDWQQASGDYWLEYKRPFVNVYANSSNVVALLEGASGLNDDQSTNSSLLLNCHYDTKPTSPGASDDAVFCAAMVETLRVLARRSTPLAHNVVFLFNGAEENPLQGSPAFLQHEWARGVTSLINLDSAGINCKSQMFQVTDARVAAAYSEAVSRPSAQSLGEALFASGLVPSDTDFRIFRDLGQMTGVDIAFSKRGHVYHTRHDSLEMLQLGVLQHSGDMLMAMVPRLADSPELATKSAPTQAVYWDYLNLFMVSYSVPAAAVLDAAAALLGLASVAFYLWAVGWRLSLVKGLALSCAGRVVAIGAGAAVLWTLTALMVATTQQLRYLSRAWLVVPLYWLPFAAGAVGAAQAADLKRSYRCGLSRVWRVQQAMAATRLLLALGVLALLAISWRGTATLRYALTVPLALSSVAALVSLCTMRRFKLPAWQQLILHLAMAAPALLFVFSISIKLNTLMLPIMGRSITASPDYIVATLNMLVVILASTPVSGLELFFSRLRLLLVLLLCSLVCVVLCFIPFSPYHETEASVALQRHSWFHSEITSYDASGAVSDYRSGVFFGRTEVNTPGDVALYAGSAGVALGALHDNFTQDCAAFTYCNLPMVTPRTEENSGGLWLEFPPPDAPAGTPPPALALADRVCSGNNCTLTFRMTGPTHMSVILWPRANVSLVAWSFQSDVIATTQQAARPVYFVYHSLNTYSEERDYVTFDVTFQVPDAATWAAPLLDVSHCAHRVAHDEERSPQLAQLVAAMPHYCNVHTTLSTRHNYVF